jgi:hypothetical protein
MKGKIEKQIKDGLQRIGNTVDNLNNELAVREELERREIFKSVAEKLLIMKLHDSNLSNSECMHWAINTAKTFSQMVMENMSNTVKPVETLTDADVAKEFFDRNLLKDTDVVQEVYDRGLVADVLFTNEDLVESYGYVKKSETEF